MIRLVGYFLCCTTIWTLVASCNDSGASKEVSTASTSEKYIEISREQLHANDMKLVGVSNTFIPSGVSCSGLIDVPPQNRATISPIMAGYVRETKLLVGDTVQKGQTLLVLENPEYIGLQQQYMEQAEELKYLEAEFRRQQTLMDEKITSQKAYLLAESAFKSARARLNGLADQLSMLGISREAVMRGDFTSTISLRAPISGRVTKMAVNRGMFVDAAATVMEIVDDDHTHLELSVYERDVLRIHPGQKISYRIPESGNEAYSGSVYLVGTSLQEDRSIQVHGHLGAHSPPNILTGMFVEATIVTDSLEVKTLPQKAFVDDGTSSYVLMLEKEDSTRYYFRKVRPEMGEQFRDLRAVKLPGGIPDNALFLDNALMVQSAQ